MRGMFIKFSESYEDLDTGPGNFPVALVLSESGNVEVIDVMYITFIKGAR